MTKLNELQDNDGAHKKPTRVGRGIGSGKGKTAGRGQKGQKARSGVSLKGFEGGQTPLQRRLPKFGFSNKNFRKQYSEINLDILQAAIDAGRISADDTITNQSLVDAGIASKAKNGVKLLGRGELTASVTLEISNASSGAAKAVVKAGGSITLTEEGASV
jgi:large subunit ribosomal protein L15